MSSALLPSSAGKLVQTIRKYPLLSFSILAYALTWGIWIPTELLHLASLSELLRMPRNYILPGMVLGVTGSAFLMTALTQGKAGVLRLLRRYLLWRVNWRWYTFAILGIPLIEVFLGFVLSGRPDALQVFSPASLLWYPGAYASRFYFGPVWEEAGWRGFALPRLQQRRGPFEATLLLGLLWGLWHLPLYLPGDIQLYGVVGGLLQFALFVLFAIALAFIFTWVFNHTQGSLLFAILLHGSINGTETYIQILADRHLLSHTAAVAIQAGLPLGCLALAVFLIVFTRGLGYRHYQQEAEPLDLPASLERKTRPPTTAV